jgi:hypothetical protein
MRVRPPRLFRAAPAREKPRLRRGFEVGRRLGQLKMRADGLIREPVHASGGGVIARASSRAVPASREDPVSGCLLAAWWWRRRPRSLDVAPRLRQRHAAEVMVLGTFSGPFRASLSRACEQP